METTLELTARELDDILRNIFWNIEFWKSGQREFPFSKLSEKDKYVLCILAGSRERFEEILNQFPCLNDIRYTREKLLEALKDKTFRKKFHQTIHHC